MKVKDSAKNLKLHTSDRLKISFNCFNIKQMIIIFELDHPQNIAKRIGCVQPNNRIKWYKQNTDIVDASQTGGGSELGPVGCS